MHNIPIMRPAKFISEIEEDLNILTTHINSKIVKNKLPFLHEKNIFNRRFSVVLETFADLKSVAKRIEKNIEESVKIEGKIQREEKINQEAYKIAQELTSQNKTDLKTLYVYSKIFVDKYTELLGFIFNWKNISVSNVTKFYNSLNMYSGTEIDILHFRETCLDKLENIKKYITDYRDGAVVHTYEKHNENTEWFLNNMNGEIKLVGGSFESLTPQEVLFIVAQFVLYSKDFCLEKIPRM